MNTSESLNAIGLIPLGVLTTAMLAIFVASVIQDWRSGK